MLYLVTMNDMNHLDNKKMKEKPHLTLVVNNTWITKDELAEKWKESRDNKNAETKQTELTRVFFENIEKLRDMIPAIEEWLEYGKKKAKYSRLTNIMRRFTELLNSITNRK